MIRRLFSIKNLVIFFFFLGLLFAALIFWVLYSGGSFENEKTYQPKFQNSPFELVIGENFSKPHLYYKTSESFAVGDKIESIQLLSVSNTFQKNNEAPDAKKFQIDYQDNAVDKLGTGYIVFFVDELNFDCFAVYLNKKLVQYDYKEFSLIPTPSDTWICKGFDFKKAFEN